MVVEIATYLHEKQHMVEETLNHFFPEESAPFAHHIEAMRYSLFAGGKRIRPILCLAGAEAITDDPQKIMALRPILCAIECIHTYSLIHDDLPAMDNDTLRRGKPTNHMLYGEAGAILAGDGLLTYAFDLITDRSNSTVSSDTRLEIAHILARAAGSFGMVGGQVLDIENEHQDFPFETLRTIHENKTGALILASTLVGAIGTGASEEERKHLTIYGKEIGLAFQIVDDLLNVTAATEQLGKSAGSDADHGKATYPAFFGLDETKKLAQQAVEKARAALQNFDHKADPLRALATYIATRTH